jgi:hypothetical protein
MNQKATFLLNLDEHDEELFLFLFPYEGFFLIQKDLKGVCFLREFRESKEGPDVIFVLWTGGFPESF